MKNSTLVKFSLTLVCAAVLSACGSSGGGSSNNTAPEVTPEVTPEVPEVTPETTSEGTEGVTNITENTKTGYSFGHKSVKKRESNLNVGFGQEHSNKSSATVGAMTIPLDPSLDTIVVGTANFQDKTQAIYLEDFDFRGNTANTSGEHVLEGIYVTADGVTKGRGTVRTSHQVLDQDGNPVLDENGNPVTEASRTKTGSQGKESGKALVFQEGRINYISTDETELKDERKVDTLRNRVGSVAEVYGNRTFLTDKDGDAHSAQSDNTIVPNEAFANAPFLRNNGEKYSDGSAKYLSSGRLDLVQYGRVTTKLDKREMDDFATGLNVVDGNNTRIASFGTYGSDGTEDHYFYRSNVAARNALDTDALTEHYKSGTVSYNGHAVTYGLDHSFRATNGIPNALGYQKELVSGTHVTADIDLANKTVTGSLYDVWNHGAHNGTNDHKNTLVTFNGALNTANGSIAGTSEHKGAEGTFNANVFGSNAQELGGAVKSKSSEANTSWGAVFGAAAVQPVNVVIPSNGGVSEGIDGENSKAN